MILNIFYLSPDFGTLPHTLETIHIYLYLPPRHGYFLCKQRVLAFCLSVYTVPTYSTERGQVLYLQVVQYLYLYPPLAVGRYVRQSHVHNLTCLYT